MRRKQLLQLIQVVTTGLALSAGLGVLWQFLYAAEFGGPGHFALLGFCLLPAVLGTVLIHELGHAATGTALGLRLYSLDVPLLTVARMDGRFTFRLNRVPDSPLGFVRFLPANVQPWRWGVMVAGGPAANFLAGVALLYGARLAFHHTEWSYVDSLRRPNAPLILFPTNVLVALLNMIGFVNLYFGFNSLIPAKVRTFTTDGALLLNWLQRTEGTIFAERIWLPETNLSNPPALKSDVPGVSWDSDVEQLLEQIESQALAVQQEYLGASHLLLALLAASDPIAGLDYQDVRRLVTATPAVGSLPDTGACPRWPTPRLMQMIAHAAMRALAHGRAVSRRNLWHALLTSDAAETHTILVHMNLDREQLLKQLA